LKTVYFDLRFLKPGIPSGGARYALEVARALKNVNGRFGYKFILPEGVNPGFTKSDLLEVAEPILTLRQHAAFLLKNYLHGADLYHYPHFDAPIYPGKTPLVLTIHDLHPLKVPGYTTGVKRKYFEIATALNLKRAASVIAVSNYTREHILEVWPWAENKTVVIGEGVSNTFYPRVGEELLNVKRKYKLPDDYLFYIGNAKPHKNLERLFRAFKALDKGLRERYPLVVAGVKREDVAGYSPGEYIVFPGRIDEEDLPAVYTAAYLFVFPSYAEGYGLPPLEAGACGTPSAVSMAASIPEVMGDAAVYFDPFDLKDMAEKLNNLLTTPNAIIELTARVLKRASGADWLKIASEISDLYHNILY
jgi:glycosyltransferase involved in cell wall biosynthesis